MQISLSKFIISLLITSLSAISTFANFDARYGNPFVTTYTPDVYPGEGQCFEVAVNSENMIYVANGSGILEYDGVNWQTVAGTEGFLFTSIAIDSLDRIWVGGIQGAGLLLPDSVGILGYQSLTESLDDSLKSLGRVWRIVPTPDGVYFQSPKLLVRWNADSDSPLEGDVTRWPSPLGYTMTKWVGGRLFVKRFKTPLEEMINDSL